MYIILFLIIETGFNEGLQQTFMFFNITVTTKTCHEMGIEVKVPQRFGLFGTFVALALFGLQNI